MIAVILSAGSGTRMRPISYYIPKILLPVRGKPVLNYILENFSGLNVDAFYIVASEHLELIQRYLEKTQLGNIEVVRGLGWETGGDLALAFEQINREDDAVVINGDIVTDISIADLYKSHRSLGGLATLSLFTINDPEMAKRFGIVQIDSNNKITKFVEKPSEVSVPTLVNAGIYVFGRELIEKRMKYLVPRKFKLENELFPVLAKEGKLMGYISNANYWWDVGTIESYLQAEEFMLNKRGVVPP